MTLGEFEELYDYVDTKISSGCYKYICTVIQRYMLQKDKTYFWESKIIYCFYMFVKPKTAHKRDRWWEPGDPARLQAWAAFKQHVIAEELYKEW